MKLVDVEKTLNLFEDECIGFDDLEKIESRKDLGAYGLDELSDESLEILWKAVKSKNISIDRSNNINTGKGDVYNGVNVDSVGKLGEETNVHGKSVANNIDNGDINTIDANTNTIPHFIKEGGMAKLENMGNTCFLNSAIQVMFFIFLFFLFLCFL